MLKESEIEKKLTSVEAFQSRYEKILTELDALSNGVFDESEADALAASCLLAQIGLVKILSAAENSARALKKDIEFSKAEAYFNMRKDKAEDGKKITETALSQLIMRDESVNKAYHEYNVAEKEAKELSNLLSILNNAHLTFRALGKKGA